MTETTPSSVSHVITIDDARMKNHLDRVRRGSAEEMLKALLDAAADGCALRDATSAAKPVATRVPPLSAQAAATISASCRPRPAR